LIRRLSSLYSHIPVVISTLLILPLEITNTLSYNASSHSWVIQHVS